MIFDSPALKRFCQGLKDASFITIDTEFLRERTYFPQLCLIQLAGPEEGSEAAIDPLIPGIDLSPIYALLDDPAIVKVMHAGRQDIEILVGLTGRVPHPVFDTQIAAMVAGFGEQVGYEALVGRLLELKVDKTQQFTDWSRRPLTEKQVEYAIADVVHLRGVYRKLLAKLASAGRHDWLEGEMAKLTDLESYLVKPEEAWLRFKKKNAAPHALARLRALAAWREVQAQAKNVPRGRLVKDDTLMEMALTHPSTLAALRHVRGLGNHLPERDLTTLLKVMAEASALPIAQCPASEKRAQIPADIEQARDLLKLLLKLVCDEGRVSSRMVAGNDDLTAIAEGARDLPLFEGWRGELFGEKAVALLEGRLSFRFDPAKRSVRFSLDQTIPAAAG